MSRSASKPVLVLNGEEFGERLDLGGELLAAGVEVGFRNIEELAIEIGVGGSVSVRR